MAALEVGPVRVPVSLSVGNREWPIGTLEVPIRASQVTKTTLTLSTEPGDMRQRLAAMLRAAADQIEQEVPDAPAHPGSDLAAD